MLSTALKRSVITLSLVWGVMPASAEPMPHKLTEPAFGLAYDSRQVKFESLPESAFSDCDMVKEPRNTDPVWFLFGRISDEQGRTFYAISGVELVRHPDPGGARYLTEGAGLIFMRSAEGCVEIGGVQETFNARSFQETPEAVLRKLAEDMAGRYVQAFGGTRQLKAAMQRQRIKPDPYALELNAAFKPYLDSGAISRPAARP